MEKQQKKSLTDLYDNQSTHSTRARNSKSAPEKHRLPFGLYVRREMLRSLLRYITPPELPQIFSFVF